MKRQGSEVVTFEEEIEKTRIELARLSEAITTLEGEITRIHRSIKYTKQNIKRVDKHSQRVQKLLEDEKTKMGLLRAQRETTQKKMRVLRKELAEMRLKVDLSRIQEMEIQREKLAEEIIGLRQSLVSTETEFSTIRSKLENVLQIGSKNIKIQLRKVKKQISIVEGDVEEAKGKERRLRRNFRDLRSQRKSYHAPS